MNITNPVAINIEQDIAVITIDYPPVNALGQAVRQGLLEAIEQLEKDVNCKIIIIQCLGKTFIAGADIKEFGAPPLEPHLPDIVNRIEACRKPVVASLFGTALGGGLEVALACHYRVALSNAKVGLPEVNLGLIPGAGGTQRLMRIVGIEKSLEMITTGKHLSATSLQNSGLFDALFEPQSDHPLVDLHQMTRSFCKQLLTGDLIVETVGDRLVDGANFDWQSAKSSVTKKARGRIAPIAAFDVIHQTWNKTITEGMVVERAKFLELKDSEQSAALRYAFGAEKKAARLSTDVAGTDIKDVGIIGGGTMGAGICTSFLAAGFNVILIEQTNEAAQLAHDRVSANFTNNVNKARISQDVADKCLSALTATTNKKLLAKSQLIIEAIFEDIEVKKTLFKELDNICNKQTIFATNTSYLDINEIAAATSRSEQVIGMHFFSPANIMKLLEVVKADKSSDLAISTAMKVGKKLSKISVLVNVCFGFAGNRMYSRYGREIQQMLLEGAKVTQIDKAMTDWGMAMGPLAVQDLSGIDIGHNARSSKPFPEYDPGYFRPAAMLVDKGRLGRKTGAGFYQYDEQGKAVADPDIDVLISEKAKELGIEQKSFSDNDIVHRAIYALISEGLQLFNEGIVQRLSDIDVIWLHGYGFPRYRGGPLFQAQYYGADKVNSDLNTLRELYGDKIWPNVNYDF